VAVTYDSLKDLGRKTMKGLLAAQGWQKFLAFACRNFKLPFSEQVLVYAQRPEVSAILKSGDWDTLYGRTVKKGSHGIPVPDGQGGKLKYYYDITDTDEGGESRPVPLWKVLPEYRDGAAKALASYLGGLEGVSDFAEALLSAAKRAVGCTLDDRLSVLKAHRKGSLLEGLDAEPSEGLENDGMARQEYAGLTAAYRAALENSVGYMLLVRCDVDPAPYLTDEDFSGVLHFNTPSTLNILGNAVMETAAMCLSVIAKAVRKTRDAAPKQDAEPKPEPVVLPRPAPEYGRGSSFTIGGAVTFVIMDADLEKVSYCLPDEPGMESDTVSRKQFEQWLAAGFIQPVRQAVPA